MGFDLPSTLRSRAGEGPALWARYLNPQTARVVRSIGFDRRWEHGRGCYLYDDTGARYLDFLSGFGVFGLGRSHPTVRATLHDVLDGELPDLVQMDTPLLAGLLAEALIERAPDLDRVYFCNSGTEAVEAALKFARCATGRARVLYCAHAFHGLTAGSLSVNGAKEFRDGFGPLLPGTQVPLGRSEALRRQLSAGDVAALVIETVQGKGVQVVPDGFMAAASALLHRYGALLICDEVQTGLGRTGRLFSYEHDQVQPDLVTLAKTLSGGFVPRWRHPGHVDGVPAGVFVDGSHAGARFHLRHQRPRHGGRAGDPVRDRRRGVDRQRGPGGRRAHGGLRSAAERVRADKPGQGTGSFDWHRVRAPRLAPAAHPVGVR